MANGAVTINNDYFRGSGVNYNNIQPASYWYESYNKTLDDMLKRAPSLLSVLQNRLDNDPTILALQEGSARVVQPDGGAGGAFSPQIQLNALAMRRAQIASYLWTAFNIVVSGTKITAGLNQNLKYKPATHLMLHKMGWKIGNEDVISALKGNLGDAKRNEALYGIYGIVLSAKYNGISTDLGDKTYIAYDYYTRVYNQYQTFDNSKKWK